ncbi:hypothetical protein [Streptomyces sp. TRM49041]|uniref:hypothetical protein n=1 Tax=Streptomyces sp. TRM49041 TaxID=2603216 RepID=UPI0011EEC45B|nr:hypothetical protein [Streptomyces sp. TRM49041]
MSKTIRAGRTRLTHLAGLASGGRRTGVALLTAGALAVAAPAVAAPAGAGASGAGASVEVSPADRQPGPPGGLPCPEDRLPSLTGGRQSTCANGWQWE